MCLQRKCSHSLFNRFKNRKRIVYVECIIDRKNIAFWFFNERTNSFDLIKVYVDNEEYKPSIINHSNKSISQIIRDSFNEGRQSARRK